MNLATRGLVHLHYRFLKGGIETLIELKAHTHNLIGGSQAQQMSQESQEQQVKLLGFPKKHQEQGAPQVNEGEMENASVRM